MTIPEAAAVLRERLNTIYPDRESQLIADWVTESLTGLKKADRLIHKQQSLTDSQYSLWQQYSERLLQHEPVQYVLEEAWFCGLKFYVNKNVLVPRPETEELVDWIITDCKFPIDQLSILDIGSGSGCIPIALKRKLRKADVWSCDKSPEALQVARQNSASLGAAVHFMQLDFLNTGQTSQLNSFDIIVSNPPYVPQSEKEQMQPNVSRHEPSMALFVPDDNPLIFYKAIAHFAVEHLNPNGNVYVEIHESGTDAVAQLFQSMGFTILLKTDLQGKPRMVKASRA